MTIFNFHSKLNDGDKADFYQEILQTNHARSRNMSFLLLVITIILLFTDKANFQKGFETVDVGYRGLFYMHVTLGISMLIFLGISWLKQRHTSVKITMWDKIFDLSFCVVISLITALFSINDQLIHGQISVYILGLFTVAIINYLSPLKSLFIYVSSFIIFIIGINFTQENYSVLRGHYLNSAVLVMIAWFLSNILYYTKVKEFISRKTIDSQKNQLEKANVELTSANNALRESLLALDESQNMIFTLALALESKDEYTRGHSERVADYAVALAEYLGLNEDDKVTLWRAAILHDTGKIGIPDAILNKSTGLMEEEWQIMKSHPERGETICSKLKFAQEILPIIRHHHERHDGKGYPDGLEGESIPYLARIVAIADMIDAVTSERPYRTAQTWEKALQELEKNAGKQFDPGLAKAFVDLYRDKK